MTVQAIVENYQFEPLDLQQNYGENMLLFIGWDHHTLFCSAHAFVVSPEQTFQELLDGQIQAGFSQHPDFKHIDWSTVEFRLNRNLLNADYSKSLKDLGFDHKSLLRFVTPHLQGYKGAHV
ncbi:phenol hydroxylase subunit P4 [Acinetobacter rongchengensis]|uniref:Phenol hydroxylase n=1 Tax=Acinetobacter rongchengensis TaxID=2419601 RepID=A0A3A8ERP7_9GAMM|nr:phenol hydroxylase subunit P4 [Acinetobacter rongchengensis]RKG37562.1 phenol hydroxylase [Acinetobacter rongchengensis]